MQGITITDSTPEGDFLAFDLIDLLRIIETKSGKLEWAIFSLECMGSSADELYRIEHSKQRVPGDQFVQLASNITQVIDGEFHGYQTGAQTSWVIIRAVDSAAYDVYSEDDQVLYWLRQQFTHVSDLPPYQVEREAAIQQHSLAQ